MMKILYKTKLSLISFLIKLILCRNKFNKLKITNNIKIKFLNKMIFKKKTKSILNHQSKYNKKMKLIIQLRFNLMIFLKIFLNQKKL